MKTSKKVITTAIASALLTISAVLPTTASAEVSASVGLSNMYLWRGIDLGSGDPAFSGDLKFSSASGAYAGIWGSSGDAFLGNEYDLYLGWGGKLGMVDIDASLWSYVYPSSDIGAGDAMDFVVSAGVGPVTGTLYETVEGDDGDDYRYMTLGYEFGKFNAMVGVHDFENTAGTPTHLQLGYNYNDNVSFAVSSFIKDEDSEAGLGLGADSDPQFMVSYTFDIK